MLVIDVHPINNHMYWVFWSPHLNELRIPYYAAVPQQTLLIVRSCELWALRFPALRPVECSFEDIRSRNAAVDVVCLITLALKRLLLLSTITHFILNHREGEFTAVAASPGVDSLRYLTARCLQLRSLRLPHLRLSKSLPFVDSRNSHSWTTRCPASTSQSQCRRLAAGRPAPRSLISAPGHRRHSLQSDAGGWLGSPGVRDSGRSVRAPHSGRENLTDR